MPQKRDKWERQFDPSKCARGSFRFIKRGGKGRQVWIVVCCPKGQWSARTKRCKVGMRAQSIRRIYREA